MATAIPPQQPTPERFMNAISAYQQTEAMKAAIELEIFTAIAEGNKTVATIAKRCKASERGVRTLCDFLTIHGFLTKDGVEYGLAADAAVFLNKTSPAYIGGAIEFLLTPRVREAHARMVDAVRKGGSALGEGNMLADNPDWVKFAEAMMPLMVMPAAPSVLLTMLSPAIGLVIAMVGAVSSTVMACVAIVAALPAASETMAFTV